MRVIIFEDLDQKYNSIKDALVFRGVKEKAILRIESISEFAKISNTNFDLAVVDLKLPITKGQNAINGGLEILKMLEYAGKASGPVLAITSYEEDANGLRADFSAAGCIIYNYDQPEIWGRALDIFLAQAKDRNRYDFLIFTALAEERQPYAKFPNVKIESVMRYGRDHWDCEVDGLSGSIVLLPRMGLVDAASIVAHVLTNYSPRCVAMSGICGGIKPKAKIGQLLIAEICWEYQSGKWYADAFEAEPYQVKLKENTRVRIAKSLENVRLATDLETGFAGNRPPRAQKPEFAPFASGSAVIADLKRLVHIKEQHRKVRGIDMETYGFHRAAELLLPDVHAFTAKTVVDLADARKSDELHEYGSYISAKFTLDSIKILLSDTA